MGEGNISRRKGAVTSGERCLTPLQREALFGRDGPLVPSVEASGVVGQQSFVDGLFDRFFLFFLFCFLASESHQNKKHKATYEGRWSDGTVGLQVEHR